MLAMPTTHDTKNSKWKISPFQCVKTFQSSIHTDIYSGSRYSFYSRHRMYYGEFVCLTFMKVVLIKKKKKTIFQVSNIQTLWVQILYVLSAGN
jgi:hypothetical protein